MACDINIGFGKVRAGIHREGSVWANKEECVAFLSVSGEKRKGETETKKEYSESLVTSDSTLHSHEVYLLFLWASAGYLVNWHDW